ncbi:MAG: hypothetical protein AAF479_15410 [Pseudomonadota bacterium]
MLYALPEGVRLEVLVGASVQEIVEGWLGETGRLQDSSLHPVPDNLNFSLWLQDPLLVRTDGSMSVSDAFERYDDLTTTRLLLDTLKQPEQQASIAVDGGNVLVHGGTVLVSADAGADAPSLSAFDPGRTVTAVGTVAPCAVERSRETDRPRPGWREILDYLSAETTHQPIFHLDHMIAPCGEEHGRPRFMVGSPRMGAKAARHPLWPHAQAEAFDEIARLLRGRGMAVVRNPQPLGWVDRPELSRRRWFYLPVNNVLIDGNDVLLPCFANDAWPEFEAVDAENIDLWQSLGFDVVPIPGLMALAEAMGGPRCMVKVLERV